MGGRSVLVMGALLAGCQLIVPSDAVQCKTDTDCNGRGGPFAKSVCVDQLCLAEADKCLGHVDPIVEDPTMPLHSRIRLVNVADQGIPNIQVLVCAARDEYCQSPLSMPPPSDADGYVYLLAWKNFRGTVQVKDPPAGSDLMKTKVHLFPAVTVDDKPDLVVPPDAAIHLITRALLSSQVEARTMLDPTAGHIIAATVDCANQPRAGVSVSLTSDRMGKTPLQFYFTENRSASVTATETFVEGAFGFANVAEGPVVMEAFIPSLGRKSARVEFWLNKDTISTFQLGPSFIPP